MAGGNCAPGSRAAQSNTSFAPIVSPSSYIDPASINSARDATCPYVSCVATRRPLGRVEMRTAGAGNRCAGTSGGRPGGGCVSGSEDNDEEARGRRGGEEAAATTLAAEPEGRERRRPRTSIVGAAEQFCEVLRVHRYSAAPRAGRALNLGLKGQGSGCAGCAPKGRRERCEPTRRKLLVPTST